MSCQIASIVILRFPLIDRTSNKNMVLPHNGAPLCGQTVLTYGYTLAMPSLSQAFKSILRFKIKKKFIKRAISCRCTGK